MGQVLDLDAVVVETTPVRKTINGVPREWQLRDDIPPEIMLAVFGQMAHAQVQGEIITALRSTVDEQDVAAVGKALDEIGQTLLAQKEEMAHICGEVFRHSYPETTDADIRAWFTDDERTRIVQLFFTRQLQGSLTPSSATTETPTPNRQQRRTSTRKSSGAIPSQKRLSRAMQAL